MNKRDIRRWWMCDFMGGMADPINYNIFMSCLIGSGLGLVVGLILFLNVR